MMALLNRLVVFLIGTVLAASGLLLMIEAVLTSVNYGFIWIPGHAWLASFETTRRSAPIVIAISVGVAVLGFLLFVIEIRPHPKRLMPYRTAKAGQWLLLRRSTEAHLGRRLLSQAPTGPVKARLKPTSGRWVLTLEARAATSSRPILEAAGKSELVLLHAPRSSRVRVKTTGTVESS